MRKYDIIARQTNANTADGFTDWFDAGEWEADSAEDAVAFWMDEMKFENEIFKRVGKNTYRVGNAEFDVRGIER